LVVRGHGLRVLERAAVRQLGRDPGRPKTVVADRRHDACGNRALAHHAPGVGLGHRLRGEGDAEMTAAGAEEKALLVLTDLGGGDAACSASAGLRWQDMACALPPFSRRRSRWIQAPTPADMSV